MVLHFKKEALELNIERSIQKGDTMSEQGRSVRFALTNAKAENYS